MKHVRLETLKQKSINKNGRAQSKIRVKRIILWDFVPKVRDVHA